MPPKPHPPKAAEQNHAPLAVKLDREKVRPCHSSAALHGESTGLNIRPVVHPIDLIHGEAFKKAVFNHGQGAARTFFGRLEHQNDAAAKVPMLRKVTRGSQSIVVWPS